MNDEKTLKEFNDKLLKLKKIEENNNKENDVYLTRKQFAKLFFIGIVFFIVLNLLSYMFFLEHEKIRLLPEDINHLIITPVLYFLSIAFSVSSLLFFCCYFNFKKSDFNSHFSSFKFGFNAIVENLFLSTGCGVFFSIPLSMIITLFLNFLDLQWSMYVNGFILLLGLTISIPFFIKSFKCCFRTQKEQYKFETKERERKRLKEIDIDKDVNNIKKNIIDNVKNNDDYLLLKIFVKEKRLDEIRDIYPSIEKKLLQYSDCDNFNDYEKSILMERVNINRIENY